MWAGSVWSRACAPCLGALGREPFRAHRLGTNDAVCSSELPHPAPRPAGEFHPAQSSERIRRAQESLTRVSRTLAEAMYRETRGNTAAGPRTSDEPKDGEVVDAEFKDVDDRKS